MPVMSKYLHSTPRLLSEALLLSLHFSFNFLQSRENPALCQALLPRKQHLRSMSRTSRLVFNRIFSLGLLSHRTTIAALFGSDMVAGSKRKAAEAGISHHNFGIGEYLETSRAREPPRSNGSESNSMDDQDGAWATVESKSSRKKRLRIEQDPDAEPSLNFHKTRPERVELKALQSLVLYVLADGMGPTWLAVNNAKQIKKVVVLMVPGLDREMLEDSKLWDGIFGACESEHGSEDVESAPRADLPAHDGLQTPVVPPLDPNSEANGFPSARERLLKFTLQVRAPGDSRMTRVHSPLQNMLIAPFSDSSKQKAKSDGKDDKSFQAVRTHVAEFVHSADQLRDAEYPIHAAAFKDPRDANLEHDRREKTGQSTGLSGWVDTNVQVSEPTVTSGLSSQPHLDPLTRGLRPYAIDCEMVLTSDDEYSLARISLINWSGKTILDKYVKPSLFIKNYFTEFSGITEDILKNVTTTLQDIQKELLKILGHDSILLGHSLESDLNALKLTHPFVIDTSIIYPHPRGLPLRSSLKFLAKRYLKREIQKGGAKGHDSVEDARAVLDLVKMKCENGPRWGTLDANGESIFRRIGGTMKLDEAKGEVVLKTSAIVEYGTPERGLGKDATYHVACENDDGIVNGVLRAAHGDLPQEATAEDEEADSQMDDIDGADVDSVKHNRRIPPGGVDFIWTRLKDLEAVRGWNTLDSDKVTTTTTKPPSPLPSTSPSTLRTAQRLTLQRILKIYTSLPPRTLFMVYSGTNDMRPLLRLQNLHAQYKREFKVKKWDDLSVKWTDNEEQEMKRVCEMARRGVGVLAIT